MQGAGEVSEWLKEHAWKACMRATVSGVRIPISPPVLNLCGSSMPFFVGDLFLGGNCIKKCVLKNGVF